MKETSLFSSASSMEGAALEAARKGALVLTPTGRLAKAYRHEWRMEAVRNGAEAAWETPPITGLARWIRAQFEALWMPRALLSKGGQLACWATACEAVPSPGFTITPSLYARFQETFDLLTRKGIDPRRPGGVCGKGGTGIAAWRSEVTGRFLDAVRRRGFCTWVEAVQGITEALSDGRLPCPPYAVAILREEAPESLDALLFKALENAGARVELWCLATPGPPPVCKVFASPEQECRAACHEAREAWNASGGQVRLGIVALDGEAFPLLQGALDDLCTRQGAPEGTGRFNIAWGQPLSRHPVFNTALLPLNLAGSDRPAALLSCLLASPLVSAKLHGVSAYEIRRKFWGDGAPLDLGECLRKVPKGLAAPLERIVRPGERPISVWIADLREAWAALEFPFRGTGGTEDPREEVAIAWEKLDGALCDLARLAPEVPATSSQVVAWIREACGNLPVVAPGTESSGIQVLSAVEAFGLPFDGLWVVGCHSGVLPAPGLPEPLLSPQEAREVAGLPHEEAWRKAEGVVASLSALCPPRDGAANTVRWSRSYAGAGSEPILASPLMEDLLDGAAPFRFDVWGERMATWLPAPWLAGAAEGLAKPTPPDMPPCKAIPGAAPARMSVSALRTFLWCPFQYFAKTILHMEPLAEPPEGVTSQVRGEVVHAILKDFVQRVEAEAPIWPAAADEAWSLLSGIARTAFEACSGDPEWRAEWRRLLGDATGGAPGILRVWLEKEREHWLEGWRPVPECLEATFEGLRFGGSPITVRGKVDRVDRHPDRGLWIMDYKTGSLPSKGWVSKDFLEPQLPAYTAAVMAGLVGTAGGGTPWEGPVDAGYIPLKSRSLVAIEPFSSGKARFDRALVDLWARVVEERLRGAAEGFFAPSPGPDPEKASRTKAPCANCGLAALCCFYDDPERALNAFADVDEGSPL